jgi:hypothetical protein
MVEHEAQWERTSGLCCFNHVIPVGLPTKNGIKMKQFDYEQSLLSDLEIYRTKDTDRAVSYKYDYTEPYLFCEECISRVDEGEIRSRPDLGQWKIDNSSKGCNRCHKDNPQIKDLGNITNYLG